MLRLLHKRPESSTGMLLGHWYGTAEGDLLVADNHNHRIQRIVTEIGELKARPFDALNADDKTRLRELIRALRDLDARTAPGAA